MERCTRARKGDLVLERERGIVTLRTLELHFAELDQQYDLECAIADAEERGDWRLAAQLRRACTLRPLASSPA